MSKKTSKVIDRSSFLVYLNGNKPIECKTEDEVWDILLKRAWDDIYEVTYKDGYYAKQFIPF